MYKIRDIFRFYGVLAFLSLVLDVLRTRLFYRPARLVRRPIYIRTRAKLEWGLRLTTGVGLRVDVINSHAKLNIGQDVQINDYCHIGVAESIIIGDRTIIGSKVLIIDHSHGNMFRSCINSSPSISPIARPLESAPVKIGKNCWIGEGVNILPGSDIGNGCIVAAGAVLSGAFPNNTLIKGNPGRVAAKYNFEELLWELC